MLSERRSNDTSSNPAEDSSAASALPGNCQHLRNVICTVLIWLSDKLGGRKWLAVLGHRLFALLMAFWMLKARLENPV